MNDYKVTAIYIYPVKSLSGISLDSSVVEERGFKYDRRWMLVDESNRFITQRTHPQMALLQPEIKDDKLIITDKSNKLSPLFVPLNYNLEKEITVQVWNDNVNALLYDDDINSWFTEALNFNCKLVYMSKEAKRKVDEKYAANKTVGFADGFPFMIIGEESLNDLNSKLKNPVPMIRFRPNIVFSGGEPFDEDGWKSISIGDVQFKVVKPCSRCVITTINPDTAEKGKEPLNTLSKYRKVNGKVNFGMNAVAEKTGVISVGDEITVS